MVDEQRREKESSYDCWGMLRSLETVQQTSSPKTDTCNGKRNVIFVNKSEMEL